MDKEQVGIAAAVTAAVVSPQVRGVARRGVVYGVAGVLKAGDVVFSTARGAARGAQAGVTGDGSAPPAKTRRAPAQTGAES